MAELGAEDTALRVDRQKIKQPEVLKKAGEQAQKTLALGATSPEERERVAEHYAKPFLKQTERYYEGQGLRFSTERREATSRGLAENIYVPLIQQEREQSRADLQTAANVGGLQAQTALAGEQARVSAEQFAQGLNLDKQRFAETARQFDVADERQKSQFAQELGLRRDELDQVMQRWRGEMGARQTEFAVSTTQAAEQFAQSIGLDKQRFAETARQFDASNATQKAQFAQELGMRGQELEQVMERFRTEFGQRQTEFAETLSLSQSQAALERAEAMGYDHDPITGLPVATLSGRQQKLNEKVQRAAAIGKWREEDVEFSSDDAWKTLADLGVDPSSAGVGGDPPADTGGGGTTAADTARTNLQNAEAEAAVTSRLPDWSRRLGGVPEAGLQHIVGVVGHEKAEALFTSLQQGVSLNQIQQTYGQDGFNAVADIGDDLMVVGTAPDGSPLVRAGARDIPGFLKSIDAGTWTANLVNPVIEALRAGDISTSDINRLRISQSRKLHILQAAGAETGM